MPNFLRPEALGLRWNCSTRTVARRLKEPDAPRVTRIGKFNFVSETDAEEYERRCRV